MIDLADRLVMKHFRGPPKHKSDSVFNAIMSGLVLGIVDVCTQASEGSGQDIEPLLLGKIKDAFVVVRTRRSQDDDRG